MQILWTLSPQQSPDLHKQDLQILPRTPTATVISMAPAESLLRRGSSPIVIAHRGASARAPENTMPAFTAALAAGAAWIETDVQPTADGALVLLHDDDVDRTTDGNGPVRSLPWREVAALDAGAWFGTEFAGTPVPLLEDLLAQITGGRRLLLEIKGEHTSSQLARLLATLDETHTSDRVLMQSFEIPVLKRLRSLRPDEPLGVLVEEIDADPVARCRELGAVAYNPDYQQLLAHPDIVADLHAAGVALMPWTADEPADWAALTGLGVDGIITNRPADLLTWQAAQRA